MRYDCQVLQRFYESLGNNPHVMNEKGEGCKVAARITAEQFRYVSLNQRRIAYLVFDIDNERGGLAPEYAGLPPPTMIVHKRHRDPLDPKPTAVHILYELTCPVSDGLYSRPRPVRFLEACERKMTIALGGDTGYTAYLVKNPLADTWHVTRHDVTYELNELWEYVKDIQIPELRPSTEGRNSTLFKSVSAEAARIYREEGAAPHFDRVVAVASDLNTAFQIPLPVSEVRTVARSVTGHYRKSGRPCHGERDHGAMGFVVIEAAFGTPEHATEMQARQAAGGAFAAARKARDTEQRIKAAVEALRSEGVKISPNAVATRAAISRSQIYRAYSHLLRVAA